MKLPRKLKKGLRQSCTLPKGRQTKWTRKAHAMLLRRGRLASTLHTLIKQSWKDFEDLLVWGEVRIPCDNADANADVEYTFEDLKKNFEQ